MQIRYFSKVPYLSFFDFGSNKGLCPLFQSPLFEVSTVLDQLTNKVVTCNNLSSESMEKNSMQWNRNADLNNKHITGTMTWHKNRLFILGNPEIIPQRSKVKRSFNVTTYGSQVEWLGTSSTDFCFNLINTQTKFIWLIMIINKLR